MKRLCKFLVAFALFSLTSCAPCSEAFDISAWEITTSGAVSVNPGGSCEQPTSVAVTFESVGFFRAKRYDSAKIGTLCDTSYSFRSSCESKEASLKLYDGDVVTASATSNAYGATLSAAGITLSGNTAQILQLSAGVPPCAYIISDADMVCE